MPPPNQPEPPIVCTVCGTPLVAAQCPRCLLSLGSSFGLPGDEVGSDDLLDPHQVRSFGDYELLEEIARGGMGIVYRARQVSLDREVAVKMILAGELAGKESLRMFQREAHAAATLHHPNIVPVYEIGEHETQHYFTMRLVPGRRNVAMWAKALEVPAEDGSSIPEGHQKLAGGEARNERNPRNPATTRPAPAGAAEDSGTPAGVLSSMRVFRWLKPPANFLRSSGTPKRAVQIAVAAAQVARAVAYAHSRGVLHRDLKPSNILWDDDAGPQVTDFGLAKLLNESDGTATRATQVIGSPSYMAPEQMGGRVAEISTATDVYGLGAVLYEMLSGRPPFSGASAIETMRRAAVEAPAPLTDVPKDLRTVCLKCLAKKPEDRYASAAALAEDLECFARGEPVSAVPLSTLQMMWRWAQRRPRIAALIGLCVVLLVAGVAGIAWQWRKTERARAEQAKALAHLQWQEIGRWLDEGQQARALAYLASLIRERPDRWQAVMYAMAIVEQHSFPLLAGPAIYPPTKLTGKVAFAPDGSWLAAAGEDRVVRIWDVVSGNETAQFSNSTPVTALAVADGPLAIATQDGALTFRAGITTSALALPRADASPIQELRFSADGTRLVARSKARVEIWPTGALDQPPRAFTLPGEIAGAEISADGARVLVWNAKSAVVWETATGLEMLRVQAAERFRRGTIAAAGGRVALLDGAYIAGTWDAVSGQPLREIRRPLLPLSFLALDHSGTRLTAAGSANDVIVYDVESGLPVSPPMRHHYFVMGLSASADGTRTVSHGWDDTAIVWDAQQGRRAMSPIVFGGGANKTADVALSRDGHRMLVHLPERQRPESIMVWRGSARSEPLRHAVEGQRGFDAGPMSPDGRLGVLGLTPSRRCHVYELATGRVLLDKPTAGDVYVPLFSPDMKRCYALTANGWLYGWDLETGAELWPPNHQPGYVRPGAISPDGTRIIAGHNDGHIRIYDTATGEVVQTLDHPGEVKVLRFAPDGSGRFLSASTDRLTHLWDLPTGKKLQTFAGHSDVVIAGAWSRDARFIATASYDTTARVWDVANGRPVGVPMPHLGWLSHLEFSPDGTRLATVCRDGTARLWHPRTGQPASPPLALQTSGEAVRFTADGKAFVVRDHDGFRFWDTANAEPVTPHYAEPSSGGVGMDSENWRAIMTPDGTRVFLAAAMNDGAFWSIPQPRSPAPAWLPAFLETLAGLRLDDHGELRLLPPHAPPTLPAGISEDEYAAWARKIMGDARR